MPLMMTEEAADDEVELDSPCCTTVRLARRFRKVLDDEGVVVFIRPGSSAKKSETSVPVCFNHIWLVVEQYVYQNGFKVFLKEHQNIFTDKVSQDLVSKYVSENIS